MNQLPFVLYGLLLFVVVVVFANWFVGLRKRIERLEKVLIEEDTLPNFLNGTNVYAQELRQEVERADTMRQEIAQMQTSVDESKLAPKHWALKASELHDVFYDEESEVDDGK